MDAAPPADLAAPLASVRADFDELFGPDIAPVVRRMGERPRGGGPVPDDDADARDAVWSALVELGGLEGGHLRSVALAELMGEVAYRGPVQDTLLARALARGAPDGVPDAVAGRLRAGSAAVAVRADGRGEPGDPPPMTTAGGLLGARRRFVPFAAEVDTLLVVGTTDAGIEAYPVPPSGTGVRVERQDEMSRGDLYRVDVTDRPVTADDRLPVAPDCWAAAVADAMLRQAGYLLGLARGATELAAGYADRRTQFGQPLRRFQWISYGIAATEARTHATEALVRLAGWRRDAGEPADRLIPQALAAAAELARDATTAAMQVHGAHGMTEDCDAQLYFRLAGVEAVRFGAPSALRVRAGRLLAADAAGCPATGTRGNG